MNNWLYVSDLFLTEVDKYIVTLAICVSLLLIAYYCFHLKMDECCDILSLKQVLKGHGDHSDMNDVKR